MARFRKVDTKIWNDEKFRGLSDDSKFAFFFVLTHPNLTALGAMRGTLPGLAAELNWPIKRFCAAIQPLRTQHMVEVSEDVAWVCLPKFLKYNEPEGPNSVKKAWVAALDLLPECPEKQQLVQRCRAYLLAKSDDFRHAIGDAIWDAFGVGILDAKSDPSPIQEQEQEQEQESPLPPKGESSSHSLNGHNSSFEIFWEAYPKKRGKGPAEKAWAKIKPDDMLLGTMLAKIDQAKQTSQWMNDRGKFIPHPATWLNAKGWEDEYEEPATSTAKPPRIPL